MIKYTISRTAQGDLLLEDGFPMTMLAAVNKLNKMESMLETIKQLRSELRNVKVKSKGKGEEV